MADSNQLNRSWKVGWVLLIMTSALISSRMLYMAPIILALSYPVAQMISISLIPNSKYVALWLIHIAYWLVVLGFGITEKVIFLGMIGSSILGEVLIQMIVTNVVKWRWLLFNTCAMMVLIVSYRVVSSITYDLHEYIALMIIVVMFGLSALLSAQGIKLKAEG